MIWFWSQEVGSEQSSTQLGSFLKYQCWVTLPEILLYVVPCAAQVSVFLKYFPSNSNVQPGLRTMGQRERLRWLYLQEVGKV